MLIVRLAKLQDTVSLQNLNQKGIINRKQEEETIYIKSANPEILYFKQPELYNTGA